MRDKFWEKFPLEELTTKEWEALCDGCGRCCLIKLQDEDDDELYYTSVSCQYLCQDSIRCTEYPRRNILVPGCVPVTPEIARQPWLPNTCAYRLLAEDKALPNWHPLITGDSASVERAGISAKGRIASELDIPEEEQEEHIVQWVSADADEPVEIWEEIT